MHKFVGYMIGWAIGTTLSYGVLWWAMWRRVRLDAGVTVKT